ncbi:MAG TPA: hypothetical protein VGG33_20595 [Polyangia bacterium]
MRALSPWSSPVFVAPSSLPVFVAPPTGMDVLALIVACSVYPDQAVVRAMVELSSRGNPNFVGDVATFTTYDDLASRRQADRLVTALESRGGRPVLGLMGLPPLWAQRYARPRRDLFDPCVNLWIGTAVLSGHHDACVTSHAAIFMDGSALPRPVKTPAAAAPSAPPASPPPASRAWASVAPQSSRAPNRSSADAPLTPWLEAIAPASSIRACTLSRFAAELGVSGYTEAVLNLLPQQRRLFGLAPLAPLSAVRVPGPNAVPETAPILD